MYKIFDTKHHAEKLQDDILKWYKSMVDANAERWSDVNKHQSKSLWAVPVPENFKYPFTIQEKSYNDLEEEVIVDIEITSEDTLDDLVEELEEGWYKPMEL